MTLRRVSGAHADLWFRRLRAATGKAPHWNFHKYLIAPDGKTVYRFPAQVEPDSAEILGRLTPMLKQGAKKTRRDCRRVHAGRLVGRRCRGNPGLEMVLLSA